MKTFYLLVCLSILSSCSSDDNEVTNIPNTNPAPSVISPNITDINEDKVQEGYVLAVVNGAQTSYLIDKKGYKVKEWNFEKRLGNDLELLDSGNLLGMFKTENINNQFGSFGGFGGVISIINPQGDSIWDYNYASDTYLSHHDVEQLPNGNILFIAWEKMDTITAQNNGLNGNNDIYPETLIEVNPITNQIIWKWNSINHLIQDFNSSADNYGIINQNPQLIDINYNSSMTNGDIMHANGISYDQEKDVIYLSVNFYNEVWVIDHSTTTVEAKSNTGGNYNKGGDLIYRFGNPQAYQNNLGTRLFYNNHYPNLIDDSKPGGGNMLVYMNGEGIGQSTVYEFNLPENFQLLANTNNEPEVAWSYTNPTLFNPRVSGAVRLTNGNTLICEGDFGFWEVTSDGEIAWKYSKLDDTLGFWRGYDYYFDDEAIINLGL